MTASRSNPRNDQLDTPPFPRVFGPKYVLLKEIGVGGMGRVYMALSGDPGLQRLCAVKTILHDDGDSGAAGLNRRFLDEALLATKFSNENLVYVFDAAVVDREWYLAMEYIAGKTLSKVLERCAVRESPLTLGLAMHVIQELCAGLAYVHGFQNLGLIHRDVSPSNVMLSYAGGVKLIDFGIAKWGGSAAHTNRGLTWGKNHYISPEQHLGRPFDQRSDLFSAGILFWEMLARRTLFPGDQARPLRPEIPPPSRFNATVPPELDRIALKALATEPEDRFQTADEFGAAVAKYLAAGPHKKKLAQFLGELFGSDIEQETAEQDMLTRAASALKPRVPAPVSDAAEGTPGQSLVGQVLGDRYEVRRLIGSGAMGYVYEGFHRGIGKRVAIKVPRAAERDHARRFLMEANAPAQIGHANITDVTDSGATPSGDPFYVMEYLDGIDLERFVERDGPMPLDHALRVGVQICRALEAAHKAGIVHRDLKPSNVMLVQDANGELVKVLDFGVAKFDHWVPAAGQGGAELTKPHTLMGTPRYMAPEQIETGGTVDGRTDIYAVGGILYEMLAGRPAYEGDDAMEVCRQKLAGPPGPLRQWRADVPEAVEGLVLRCLAPSASERPQSAGTLAQALAECLGERHPAGTGPLATGTRNRTRVPLIGLAVVVLLVGIALGYRHRGSGSGEVAEPTPPVAGSKPSAALDRVPVPPVAVPPVAATLRAIPGGPSRKASPPEGAHQSEAGGLVEQGEAAFRKGRLLEALVLSKKALKVGGGARAHVLAGRANLGMDELAEAQAAFEAALAADPANVLARRGLEEVRKRQR